MHRVASLKASEIPDISPNLSPIPGRNMGVMSPLRSSPVSSNGISSRLKTEGWVMSRAERGRKLPKVAPGTLMILRCYCSVDRWQR